MTSRLREATIDLAAIAANVRVLRKLTGTRQLMAVVKANGYGHGAVPAARAAVKGGADWLGVIDIDEALELRAAGITTPILSWLHAPSETFTRAIEADIDLGMSSADQLRRVAAAGAQAAHSGGVTHPPAVHLKVDTGLSRNGAERSAWENVFGVAAELERSGAIRVRGLFSHLANAGREEDTAQRESFEEAMALASDMGLSPELRHLASTEAALALPSARYDMVRLGLGIYGLSPFDDPAAAPGLTPALQLSAEVVGVKRVPAGSGVSYGFRYRAASDTSLALIPLGYGDGIPWQASNRAPVSINGVTYRVAGRVAMDQFVVDVGDGDVKVGDRAVLFGDPATGVPSADDWAEAAGTINYEIITRLGGRIHRRYVGEG